MVASLPGRSPTRAAPRKRGTARARGDREVLGMHPLEYNRPKYNRPKYNGPKYNGPKYNGPKYNGPSTTARSTTARSTTSRESTSRVRTVGDRQTSDRTPGPRERYAPKREGSAPSRRPDSAARRPDSGGSKPRAARRAGPPRALVRCDGPIRPHLRAGAALPGEEHGYSVKTPKKRRIRKRPPGWRRGSGPQQTTGQAGRSPRRPDSRNASGADKRDRTGVPARARRPAPPRRRVKFETPPKSLEERAETILWPGAVSSGRENPGPSERGTQDGAARKEADLGPRRS